MSIRIHFIFKIELVAVKVCIHFGGYPANTPQNMEVKRQNTSSWVLNPAN